MKIHIVFDDGEVVDTIEISATEVAEILTDGIAIRMWVTQQVFDAIEQGVRVQAARETGRLS